MKDFLKKSITTLVILTFFIGGVSFAQESDTETKLQETKETVNELVEAKDENSPFDISLRIKTFKKVIELSISETKDLKINLIALEDIDKDLISWREKTVKELNKIIKHYEDKLQEINEQESDLSLEEIQTIASEFKSWREENYIPVQNKIQNLLLINKESKALKIAKKRLEKINNDLQILQRAKIGDTEKLRKMFKNAEELINNAEETNQKASEMIIEQYSIPEPEATSTPVKTSTSTENSTTTIKNATSTEKNTTSTPEITTSTTQSATSTEPEATSTANIMSVDTTTSTATSTKETAGLNDSSKQSIRDLIGSSWGNIKSAYQIFIEMSGFVRKSLE
ncbi:MAG TPA: hypothetical protein VKO61_01060 [Candidatus Paceibacterota bacterium]|nr:hypothetical protein [Candidatus Paceibacterota bacterium]